MRDAALAEAILSLVLAPDRAAEIAGDLLESERRPLALWTAVFRISAGYVWCELSRFFVPMAAGAAAFWLLYALQSLFYSFVGNLLVYVADHHTGLELVADLPWPPPPPSPESWVGPLMWGAVMPYLCARSLVRRWPGRELAAWTALTFAWVALSAITKTPMPALPLVQLFTLLGALDARRRVLDGAAHA